MIEQVLIVWNIIDYFKEQKKEFENTVLLNIQNQNNAEKILECLNQPT